MFPLLNAEKIVRCNSTTKEFYLNGKESLHRPEKLELLTKSCESTDEEVLSE